MLRAIRAQAQRSFDGGLFQRDERFWALRDAARAFADLREWPSVEAIDEALSARAGVRFVLAERRPRRHRGPVDLDRLYDARIARGQVPTRERDWHDLLNALVWATFPRSKAKLHARQHEAVQAWARAHGMMIDAHTVAKLPGARTRELDALALLDEGGVLVTDTRSSRTPERSEGSVANEKCVLFGHAHYEGMVLGVPAMIGRGIRLSVGVSGAEPLTMIDAAFALRLAEPLTPEDLPRSPPAW